MLPLNLIIFLGITMFVLALVFGLQTLINYITGRSLSGFTTVILLQLILGSMTIMGIGIIGYYVARIFDEVRGRPHFILEATTDECHGNTIETDSDRGE